MDVRDIRQDWSFGYDMVSNVGMWEMTVTFLTWVCRLIVLLTIIRTQEKKEVSEGR